MVAASFSTPRGPVNIEMGVRIRVRFDVQENRHPGQLSLTISPRVGVVSTRGVLGDGILVPSPPVLTDSTHIPTSPCTVSDPCPLPARPRKNFDPSPPCLLYTSPSPRD